jgi:type IV pilus assembly protein PilW
MMTYTPLQQQPRQQSGVTLIEMMVAMAIGLVLTTIMASIYLSSKTATRRQDQLTTIQQGVRTAFEYIGFDVRAAGHLGCFSRRGITSGEGFTGATSPGLADNFAIGLEGYEYANATADVYTLGSNAPDNVTEVTSWRNSTGATTATLPIGAVAGGTSVGLTPGSDLLIVRNTIGEPIRLTAIATTGSSALNVNASSTGTCPDGTANASGFCAGSYGLIASCTAAQMFQVASATASTLNISPALAGSTNFAANATEVLRAQTVIYYVKKSGSGQVSSLYRRVFDGVQADPSGTAAAGFEQELLEGVENMQLRYAVDTGNASGTDTDPDGVINGEYVTADAVTDWSRVIAVRVGLLLRATTALDGDLANDASLPTSKPVNGVTVTLPTTGAKFDRRVYTTTVAIRNRVAY